MSSSSYSASGSAARRNNVAVGTHHALPIVACPKCQRLFTEVCKKGPNAERRFFKCNRLEHSKQACKFYKFEEDYEEWLIAQGLLQPASVVTQQYQDPRNTNLLTLQHSGDQLYQAVAAFRSDAAKINATLRQNNILLSRMLLLACISIGLSLITLLVLSSK